MSTNSINLGNQSLTYLYRQEARAKYFNRLLSQLLPYGIYEGGTLVRSNDYQISILPQVCLIKSNELSDLNISVRVETKAGQTISLESQSNPGYANTSKPYIVLRFGWSDVENNYMDMKAVAFSDNPLQTDENFILPNDLIVGKVLYEEDTPSNWIIKTVDPFDYSRRSNAFIPDSILAYRELRVQVSENNQRRVYVTSGSINTSQGRKEVAGGDYPSPGVINDTTSQGRIDLIYVDEAGVIQVEEGTPAATPLVPSYLNRKVLGEIHRGANRDSILGTDIRQTNVTRQGMIIAKDFPIEDAGDYYINKNLEDGLQEVFEFANSILGDEGSVSDKSVKDFHIDWGTATDQVSAEDVPVEDANGRFSTNNVEGNLQEIAGAGRTSETVKDNADDITTLNTNFSTHEGTDANSTTVHGLKIDSDLAGTTQVPNSSAIKEYIRTGSLTPWQSDVTYALYDAIVADGIPYRSVQAENTNNNPITDVDEIWWEVVGGGAGASITEWELAENVVAGQVLASEIAQSAQAEKTQIICVAELSGNMDGVYFDLTHPSVNYRVWIDTDNSSTPPSAGGRTLLEVDVATDDSSSTVATAIQTALGTTGNFTLSTSQNNVYVTNGTTGEVEATVNGDTPFTFVQLADGRDLTTGDKAIVADKRYENKIEVIGIAMTDGTATNNIDVQKIALFEDPASLLNFSDVGASCYLGDAGAMIQDTSLIETGEYRVFMGHAKSASSIDILIGEAEKNEFSPEYLNGLPLGTIMDWPYDGVPEGFVEADGREIVRADYSAYMDQIGEKFGDGDGSTTVNVAKSGRIQKIEGLASYTIEDDDYAEIFKVNTTGQSSVDIIIPKTVNNLEEILNIRKINDGGGQALIKVQGNDLIEGALDTIPLTNKYDSIKLIGEEGNNFEILEYPKAQYTNSIINPKMNLWQRGTSYNSIIDNGKIADRHVFRKTGSVTAVHNVERSTDVPNSNFNYSMKISVATAQPIVNAGDLSENTYRIEGYDYQKYINELGVVSFWVKTNKLGTYCFFVGNTVDRFFVREYTITDTNWKKITIPPILFNETTGTWNYLNGTGLELGFVLSTGSNFFGTPNQWNSTSVLSTSNQVNFNDSVLNEFYMTGLSMNVGVVPGLYDYTVEQDIAKAQRYFQKSYNIDTAVGTVTTVGTITELNGASTTHMLSLCTILTTKRTTPDILWYSPFTGNVNNIYDYTAATDRAIASNNWTGESSTGYPVTTPSLPVNTSIGGHFTADAEL